jgi:hypothetical protein
VGTIVPIFKNKGSNNLVINYRPATLPNTLAKVVERVIYNNISSHLLENNLLYDYQSGFVNGHDTTKQLLHITHMILSNHNSNLETRGVCLDIEATFDGIPHYLLGRKLKTYALGANVIDVITSYLSKRKLRDKVNNSLSGWYEERKIKSGVPQGSILGPLRFIL